VAVNMHSPKVFFFELSRNLLIESSSL